METAVEHLPKSLEKRLEGIQDERKTLDHPDHSTIEISENTQKSLEDLKRLAVTQTSVKSH